MLAQVAAALGPWHSPSPVEGHEGAHWQLLGIHLKPAWLCYPNTHTFGPPLPAFFSLSKNATSPFLSVSILSSSAQPQTVPFLSPAPF